MKNTMINDFKTVIVAVIIGACLICSVSMGVNGLTAYKKSNAGGITVTGSATQDITSDLATWNGYYSRTMPTTKAAYDAIKGDTEIVKKYLFEKGFAEDDIRFYAVNIRENIMYEYNDAGRVTREFIENYTLTQQISLSSMDIDKIDDISRDITKLIESGVNFVSASPSYFYTKLDELKLEMISRATDNARIRAEIIAKNSNSKLKNLSSANLGVFQLTAQNSSVDEFSSSGAYNTSSKDKTASITVRLYFEIE